MQGSIVQTYYLKHDCLALEVSNSLKTKAMTNMSLFMSPIKMTTHSEIEMVLMGRYLVS